MAALRPDLLARPSTPTSCRSSPRAARKAGVRIALDQRPLRPEKLSRYRTFFRRSASRSVDHALPHALGRGGRARPAAAHRRTALRSPGTRSSTRWRSTVRAATTRRCAPHCRSTSARQVFIAGVTDDGEEELSVDVYRRLLDFLGLTRWWPCATSSGRGRLSPSRRGAASLPAAERRGRSRTCTGRRPRHHRRAGRGRPACDARLRGRAASSGVGAENVLEPAGQGEAVLFGRHMEKLQGTACRCWWGGGGSRRGRYRPAPQGGARAPLLAGTKNSCGSGRWRARRWARSRGASARNVDDMLRALRRARGAP